MTKDCIFCKIIAGTIPSDKIKENEHLIVIKDIAPKAPIHYLIIPKKHLENLHNFTAVDKLLASEILFMAKKLAQDLSGSKAYRLVMSNGYDAGQRVFHAHMHFLSGKQMSDI